MPDSLIILRNRDRFRLFQCTLYHAVVCVQGGKCICLSRERSEADRKGEMQLVEQSIFIPPMQMSEPLPSIVLRVPQIEKALKDHWLEDLTALAQVEVIPPRKE